MRRTTCYILAVAVSLLAGCADEVKPPSLPPPPTPLSLAEWRDLPVQEKYDETTFDRLKLQNPKLKNEREWAQFMVETVIPERKKDLPDDLPNWKQFQNQSSYRWHPAATYEFSRFVAARCRQYGF